MKRFSAFLDRRDRQNKDNLRVLGKIFSKSGFEVIDRLNHQGDPYLFLAKPNYDKFNNNLDFAGIRLYCLGRDIIAFRCQNGVNYEPFGAAYQLAVKEMFRNLVKEGNSINTGKELIRYMVEEILNFFVLGSQISPAKQPVKNQSGYATDFGSTE